jgi:nickel-dependent lactate racemase
MTDGPTIKDKAILDAIKNPIDSEPVEKLAKGKKKICIAIDDLDRSTETDRIIPHILSDLNAAGVNDENIYIVVSLGTHRPLTRDDMIKKVGLKIIKRIKFYNHNAWENLHYLGKSSYGSPIYINKFFAKADLKIGIGMLSPHPYAGFSGGGKLILPGLSGMDTIELNHKPVNSALSGRIGQIEGNTRRAEMEEITKKVGLDFLVNTVSNSKGETAGIFCGEHSEVFESGAEFAKEIYSTDVKYGQDIGIFNAFPKDNELLQALNALNIWSTREESHAIVKKGGAIVIITAAMEGCGYHALGDIGMRLHIRRDKHGSFKELFNGRTFIYFSPNLIKADIYDHYPKNVLLFNKIEKLMDYLKKNFGNGSNVGIFPCAPLQMDKNIF